MAQPKIIGSDEIHAAIERLAVAIGERHAGAGTLLLLGIANGGIEPARRLTLQLSAPAASPRRSSQKTAPSSALNSPLSTLSSQLSAQSSQLLVLNSQRPTPNAPLSVKSGTLDISFHRDDIARHPIPKEFAPTHIPSDVNGATVILVDDVLFSGRTVKAALDELFDHGRPTKVELAILVDRGGRRMPFAPDYCGLLLAPADSEKIVVRLDAENPARDIIRIEPATSANRKSAI